MFSQACTIRRLRGIIVERSHRLDEWSAVSVEPIFGRSPAALSSRCFFNNNPAYPTDMLENDADCQLLFGLLAIQLRIVSVADISRGLTAWSKSRDTTLKQILIDGGALDAASGELIESAVAHHLDRGPGRLRGADWSRSPAMTPSRLFSAWWTERSI